MTREHATPNLPSRDFSVTSAFYASFGFEEVWRDAGWMILRRGGLQLEFFPYPDLDPDTSSFGSCLRVTDAAVLADVISAAGVPETHIGRPRLQRPQRESWGGLVGALIDPDGSLLRLVQEPAD